MVAAVQRAEYPQVYSSPSSHSHLRIYPGELTRTPIPNSYKAIIGDKIENLNLQVLNTPAHITHNNDREDKGTYLVELNSDYLDFSRLNQAGLEKLKAEIREIEGQSNVKHLVLSFYDCNGLKSLKKNVDIKDDPRFSEPANFTIRKVPGFSESLYDELKEKPLESSWTISGTDYFEDLLMEARTYCRLNDKKLSVIHLETPDSLKRLPGFIHENLGDAIKSSNNFNFKPAPKNETPVYTIPPYRVRQFTVSD